MAERRKRYQSIGDRKRHDWNDHEIEDSIGRRQIHDRRAKTATRRKTVKGRRRP